LIGCILICIVIAGSYEIFVIASHERAKQSHNKVEIAALRSQRRIAASLRSSQ
jgi:hypothetical protein